MGSEAGDLPDFIMTESAAVAEAGVKGLEKGRRVVVPGALNRAGALGGQHAPRGLLLRVAGKVWPVG